MVRSYRSAAQASFALFFFSIALGSGYGLTESTDDTGHLRMAQTRAYDPAVPQDEIVSHPEKESTTRSHDAGMTDREIKTDPEKEHLFEETRPYDPALPQKKVTTDPSIPDSDIKVNPED